VQKLGFGCSEHSPSLVRTRRGGYHTITRGLMTLESECIKQKGPASVWRTKNKANIRICFFLRYVPPFQFCRASWKQNRAPRTACHHEYIAMFPPSNFIFCIQTLDVKHMLGLKMASSKNRRWTSQSLDAWIQRTANVNARLCKFTGRPRPSYRTSHSSVHDSSSITDADNVETL
jgi:hypothetical protein